MSQYNGFQGTSNTQYAMKYKVTPIGTYAHEVISAMQAGFGVKEANRKWMNLWLEEYSGKMSIALTDTYTTKAFLKDFDLELANRFEGVRQDSGNPFEIGEILINHYESLGIDPKTKKVIFSDNLNPKKVLELNKAFKDRTNVIFGIGTNLTADCGHKPLNMVIKLTEADFGDGFKHAVKLSDDVGKHTGDLETINKIKGELNV
jgi:nicotinate phosphoribosyltransferase